MQLHVRLDDGLERKFLHDDSIGPGRQVRNIVQPLPIGLTGERDVGLDVGGLHLHSRNHAAARIGDAAGERRGRTCHQASHERHQEREAIALGHH